MTQYERYLFDGKCPYGDVPCYKDIECADCEVNAQEKADAEKLDKAEYEEYVAKAEGEEG